eukprot:3502683-Pleurochrysis_carterae.AAC.1
MPAPQGVLVLRLLERRGGRRASLGWRKASEAQCLRRQKRWPQEWGWDGEQCGWGCMVWYGINSSCEDVSLRGSLRAAN